MKTPIYSTIFVEEDKSPIYNFYRHGNNLTDEFSKYIEQVYPFLLSTEKNLVTNFDSLNELEEKNDFRDFPTSTICSEVKSYVLNNPDYSLNALPQELNDLNDKIMTLLKNGYDTFEKNKLACENILIVKEFHQKLDPFKSDLEAQFAELESAFDVDKDSTKVKDLLNTGVGLLQKCQKICQKIKSLELAFLLSSDNLVLLLENFQKVSLNFDDIVENAEYLEIFFEKLKDRLDQIGAFDVSVRNAGQVY